MFLKKRVNSLLARTMPILGKMIFVLYFEGHLLFQCIEGTVCKVENQGMHCNWWAIKVKEGDIVLWTVYLINKEWKSQESGSLGQDWC